MCYTKNELSEKGGPIILRQRQQLFLSINRILLLLYAPLSVALSVYYLFTGSLLHALLSLCTLFWIALPYIFHRFLHLRIGQLMLFFYMLLILFCYSGGVVLSFSRRIFFYPALSHLLGGFFFAVAAAAMFCIMTQQRRIRHLWVANLFSFGVSLTVSTVWQLIQIGIAYLLPDTQPSVPALVGNCAACLIGAALFCLLTALQQYKRIHSYPLYAFEDYAALNVKSTIQIIP